MAYNLGSAYIQVVPTTKGMGKSIEKELGGIGGQASKSMGGKLWGGLKVGAAAAGAGIAAVLGGSIAKGFQRLTAIEDAEAKLSGLGHSAEDVEQIMGSALNAVKGTAYGMGDAASLAATMVAAGIKPGEELENTLRLVADSATISGRQLSDVGLIWSQVASKGKLQGEDAMQLMEAGIPIWQMIGEEMGVTAAEAQELGSAGEVSFETFRSAMEQGLGGAAEKSGKTVRGAFANMGAAMSRFGAAILEDVYPLISPLLGRITDLFDYLADAAGPAIEGVVGWFKELAANDQVQALFSGIRDVAVELYERALKPLGTWIADNWQPIAAALGGIAAFFVGSAIVAAIGAVGGAIAAFVGGISWIGVAIGAAVGALTWFFTSTETGRAMLDTFVSFIRDTLVPGIVDGFNLVKDFVVNELWPMIQSRFNAIKDLAVQVWQGVIQPAFEQFATFVRETVMPIIQRLWTEYVQPAFMAIGALAVWLWNNAIKPAMSAIDNFIRNILGPVIVWLWQNVVSPAFAAIGAIISFAWNNVIFPVLDLLKAFLVNVLAPAFMWLWRNVIQPVWNGIKAAISVVVTWFQTKAWPALQLVIQWIGNAFNTLRDWIGAAWNWIKRAVAAVVSWFQTWVWPVLQVVIELIKIGFNALRDALSRAWSWIKNNVIAPVVNWFRDTVAPLFSAVIDRIKAYFTVFQGKLKRVWAYIRHNVIDPVVAWFRDTVKPLFDRVTGKIGDAFDTLKSTIKTAWDGIKEAAKAPIRFVVETIINDGLIGNFNKIADKLGVTNLPSISVGFARGGVLPGMSRMSDGDDQLVPMRKGEGVLVSEGLRTPQDRQAFLAANAAGRRGIGFASLMGGGFAGGGIWDGIKSAGSAAKNLAGDALDAVLDGVDFVAEALKDPSGMFNKVYDAVVGKIPGAGMVVDFAKESGSRLLDGVIEKVKGMIAPTVDLPSMGEIRTGGGLGVAQALAASMGLRMTSGTRPGARTAGAGITSLHALGRAMDFAGSSDRMMAFFNAMLPFRPTELLYTPAGGRNLHRSGRQYANTGATARNHYDHVHVGFNKGGIFDQGGLLEPGMTGINLTRKPEAVLDPAATRAYQAHAEAISSGTGGAVDLSDSTIEAIADAMVRRPLKIGNRQAGMLASAGAGSKSSLGGNW